MSNVVALEPKSKPVIPEFIRRADIDEMDDDQLDALIAAIRLRRMKSYTIYQKTKSEKDAITLEKVKTKIEKKCEQIVKDIIACDKALERMETHISELRGLRLQAGMEIL